MAVFIVSYEYVHPLRPDEWVREERAYSDRGEAYEHYRELRQMAAAGEPVRQPRIKSMREPVEVDG